MERPPRAIHDVPKKGRLNSSLHKAILDHRLHNFRILVEKMKENCNAPDIYGWTPLILSCLIDDEALGLRFVKILAKNGVEVNYRDPFGRSALHYCCIGGREHIAKYLVHNFEMLDYQMRDRYGYVPLFYAAMRGRPSMVLLLTKKYAASANSVDETDTRGRTPLIVACHCGNYVSAEILLRIGKAQKHRRDNNFFRSPAEWVREGESARLEELSRENDPLFRVTIPLKPGYSPRLTRLLRLPDMTAMYDRDKPYICEHTRKHYTCNSECLAELTKGIPEMFTHFHLPPSWEEELYINNQDSKRVLLAKLEDPEPPTKGCAETASRPANSAENDGSTLQFPPVRCISTPRLVELRPIRDKMIIPDLVTLFKLYKPQDVIEKKPAQEQDQKTPLITIASSGSPSNLLKPIQLQQYH